jgi:hypothetical protein
VKLIRLDEEDEIAAITRLDKVVKKMEMEITMSNLLPGNPINLLG